MANEENLIKFKKGKSGNPKGRPKKLISHVNTEMRKEGYEQAQNVDIVGAYMTLIQLPIEEVKEIADTTKKKNYPFLYKLVAKELLGKRGADMLEKLLDRSLGKAKQQTDITSGGEKISIPISKWSLDGGTDK